MDKIKKNKRDNKMIIYRPDIYLGKNNGICFITNKFEIEEYGIKTIHPLIADYYGHWKVLFSNENYEFYAIIRETIREFVPSEIQKWENFYKECVIKEIIS